MVDPPRMQGGFLRGERTMVINERFFGDDDIEKGYNIGVLVGVSLIRAINNLRKVMFDVCE